MKPITVTYDKKFDATPKERKHIILMDGTWNDETGVGADMLVTNIVHLARIFEDDNQDQIVRYHRGVGNDNNNNFFKSLVKGAKGDAVHKIVDRAYARFVQDWQNGDRIYIFGFSRGAAGARLLASKINEKGVPIQAKIVLKPKENKETKVVEQRIDIKKTDFDFESVKPHSVEIEFLGVWDTVSSFGFINNALRFFGWKERDVFSNNSIAKNILKAVHLVALDETRNTFVPSLMNYEENITHEVWFPGVHSDIGGSYKEDELAKASLDYMMNYLEKWNKERGLKAFKINPDAKKLYTQNYTELKKFHFHFHGKGLGKDLREIKVQVNGKKSDLKPKIHKLYYELATKKHSHAVFKVKKFLRKGIWRIAKFQYMPFNIKKVDEFDVVE